MTGRWPLHPPPVEGEALTSWLSRLAEIYGMSVEELIRHNLGNPHADPLGCRLDALDWNPPEEMLSALGTHTGVPFGRLRQMTVAGWVPWLLDTLDPKTTPESAFDTYVRQNSVLLAPKERSHRQVSGWRAWLPTDPKRVPMCRACPTCVSTATAGGFGFTLIAQLPLTLTCPQHNCRLAPAIGGLGSFAGWEKHDTRAIPVPAPVSTMDTRTHEGLRTGTVTLPRRSVHVGMWFRLLRTLIDELSISVSALRVRSKRSVQRVWEVVGHPLRAGIVGPWRPYEALPWNRQQVMLEGAAIALHLIEAGEIPAYGTFAQLLTSEPVSTVFGGITPTGDRPDYWRQVEQEMSKAIAEAQEDPAAARQLLAILTTATCSEARFRSIREDLVTLGVPHRYLPSTLKETS